MVIQVRRGKEADFDPSKMLPGEWAVSLDTRYVRMCFAPGIVLRMATYEAFEADMAEIQSIMAEARTIEEAVARIQTEINDTAIVVEDYAILSKSYAVGGTGTRKNEEVDNAKYYYEQAKHISQGGNGLVPLGTIAFENLPTEDILTNGMYNISNDFTSDERFLDGGGVLYGKGSNVYYTVNGLWDVLAASDVKGVRGSAESSFRQGNVTISPDDLGLGGVLPLLGNTDISNIGDGTITGAVNALPKTKTLSGVDVLSVLENGKYYVGSALGLPEGVGVFGYLDVHNYNDNNTNRKITWTPSNSNTTYTNVKEGDRWLGWDSFAKNSNLAEINDNINVLVNNQTTMYGYDGRNADTIASFVKNMSEGKESFFNFYMRKPDCPVYEHGNWLVKIYRAYGDESIAYSRLEISLRRPDGVVRKWTGTMNDGSDGIIWTEMSRQMDLLNYLPLSGGTLTGDLYIPKNCGVWFNTTQGAANIGAFGSYTGTSQLAFAPDGWGTDDSLTSIVYLGNMRSTSETKSICPRTDNLYDLGLPGQRLRTMYATTGTIQTSDRNRKKDIVELDGQLAKDFIMRVKPTSYKLIDGESGRTHYGMIAQDIEELLEKLGLTSMDFAGFIKSPKTKMIDEFDEDGNLIGSTTEVIEGEYEYSLRYEEFIAPLIKMVQMQQNEIDSLKEEIKELKSEITKVYTKNYQ